VIAALLEDLDDTARSIAAGSLRRDIAGLPSGQIGSHGRCLPDATTTGNVGLITMPS
jgi:hypothetical protein